MPSVHDTYQQARDYLYGLKHRGASYGIDRMKRFVEALGHPERHFPIIHLAGTNGKGSTAAHLESIYRAGGYRTGLFTSPHLVHQGERVQVNREILSHEEIRRYTNRLRGVAEEIERKEPDMHPSFFEFMTGMAFLRFAEMKVDLGIIETGLGGRLDATNVVQPALCVFTSISLDHTEILGDTLEAIAGEKVGILKPGVPSVLGSLPEPAEKVIRGRAKELGSAVHSIRERFGDGPENCPMSALPGEYQRLNAAMAVLATEVLADLFPVREDAVSSGLASGSWAGRWDEHALLDRSIILDASHNPEGATQLDRNLWNLREKTGQKPVVLCGTLGASRAKSLMEVVCRHAREIHLFRPAQPRACQFEELEAQIPGDYEGTVHRAKIRGLFPAPGICTAGEPGETLVATGSIYLIGEIFDALYHAVPAGEQALQD